MRFLSIYFVVLVLEPSSFWRGSRRRRKCCSGRSKSSNTGVLEVLSFKNNRAHLSGEKECNGASVVSIFENKRKTSEKPSSWSTSNLKVSYSYVRMSFRLLLRIYFFPKSGTFFG